jgi:REase_AHJR-like protein
MEAVISRARQRAHNIAEEYRNKGYEVIEEPSPKQLPKFLSGYRPDLLVRKGDEAIVTVVKSRSSLAKDSRIQQLAQLLQPMPHWNFELVVVGEGEEINTPEGARPFERDDILRGVKTVEKLMALGFSEPALLLAWSALEGTVRLLTEEEGIALDRFSALHILKQAVINGVISRDDYNLLMHVLKYRNALMHGFKPVDFDPNLVKDLLNTTKRLLT